jgi:hypothetical protein
MKSTMRFTAYLFFCLISNQLQAQAVVGFPHNDRIYAGYDNYFECGSTQGDTQLFMSATNATVIKKGDGYIIKPSGTKVVVVTVTNSNKEVVATQTYRVFALPNPELYLGNTISGNKLDYRLCNELKVQMDPYTTLGSLAFNITRWELTFTGSGKVISGTGNSLTDDAVEQIRIAPDGTEATIQCVYTSGNESPSKSIIGKFKL